LPKAPAVDRFEAATATPLAHVPAKWNPVRKGERLFADKHMYQHKNLPCITLIFDHPVIQYQGNAL
jgi:hypothetical protein